MAPRLRRSKILALLVLVIATLLLSGCFPGEIRQADTSPPGFFRGIWHGWIAPVSLIVQLFNSQVRIYAPNNSGWWYDFGYYIAVISGFGGLSLARKKKSSPRNNGRYGD